MLSGFELYALIDLFYKLPAPYFTKFRHFPNSM